MHILNDIHLIQVLFRNNKMQLQVKSYYEQKQLEQNPKHHRSFINNLLNLTLVVFQFKLRFYFKSVSEQEGFGHSFFYWE